MDVTQQAVENLVTQFSSALDFYRELVQNSIDAGSSAVEIWLDFLPDEDGGAGGVIEIHVDDFGEGMNEEVIDEQLTTLFSSTKEDDLTKIGKFGIGFVSVFALGPRGVLVQTGRDGEYWEVFFDQDRSFFKSPLDTPTEGTQITLFLEGDRARYTELVAASRETIDHWCRHSEAEISFEDRASLDGELEIINKPFSVDGECHTQFEREGTQIVLAYSHGPVWGFYNKGLALAVVRGSSDLVPDRLRHVGFRIKSRYLEHTLSRETVMRDENYDRAMAMVVEAAEGPLRSRLAAEIAGLVAIVTGTPAGPRSGPGARKAAAPRRWTMAERGRYFDLMDFLGREGVDAIEDVRDLPLLLSLDGEAMSLAELCRKAAADGRVFIDDQVSPIVDRLLAQGSPVILVPGREEAAAAVDIHQGLDPVARVVANALAASFATTSMVERVFTMIRGAPEVGAWVQAAEMLTRPVAALVGVETVADDHPAGALVERAEQILARGLDSGSGLFRRALDLVRRGEPRIGYERLVCARLHGAPGGRQPLFVVAHEVAPLMALPTQEMMVSELPERPEAAVNCDHPHFRALLRLAEREPEMAAYCLAKSLLLDADRGLQFDTKLMTAALGVA